MVGQQGNLGNRTSGTRAPSVTKSNWWRKIHNLNARSKLQEVSGSFNCAEKFSALVSCHRGYGSVAFYAVFSLFIVTFLYAIWKIVSAHSRSGRRPGSGSSTTVTKISPTTHAPTGYVSTRTWLNTENVFDRFHQNVKNLRPFQDEAPKRVSLPGMLSPQDNEARNRIPSLTKNIGFPMTGNNAPVNPSTTWPASSGATSYVNNYPGPLDTDQPLWNNIQSSSTDSNPAGLNPYYQLPFSRNLDGSQIFPFGNSDSNPGPYNNDRNPVEFYNGQAPLPPYPVTNISYGVPSSSFAPTPNPLIESSYGNNYYGNDNFNKKMEGAQQTSPSPLISFLSKVHGIEHKTKVHLKNSRKQQRKHRRKTRRHGKKKTNHLKHRVDIEEIEENNRGEFARKPSSRHHRYGHHHHGDHRHDNKKKTKHLNNKIHEHKNLKNHHFKTLPSSKKHHSHSRSHKRMGIAHASKVHHFHRARHRAKMRHKVRVETHRSQPHNHHHRDTRHQRNTGLHRNSGHHRNARHHINARHRINDRYQRHDRHHKKMKPRSHQHHDGHKKHSLTIHHRESNVHVHHPSSHHSILNYKRYRIYRRHHSVKDEIRGKWKVSRHRVRTCKRIDRFETQGTVKLSRTEHNRRRYLHTVLICRPVRLRLRRRRSLRRRSALRYAQLCRKKWYVTKGVIHVRRTQSKGLGIPSYDVHVCVPSYARAKKLLPAEGKGTRVWNIAADVISYMKRENTENRKHKSNSVKHAHEHISKKRGSRHHKRRKGGMKRKSKSGSKGKNRKHSFTSHHLHKKTKHKKASLRKSNHKNHNGIHGNKSNMKKLAGKGHTKHDRKRVKATTKKSTSKAEQMDSDKAFFGKLLKVLRLAKLYDKKKGNVTHKNNVLDSLEAVLTQSQNNTANVTHAKKNSTVKSSLKRKHLTHLKSSKKNSLTTALKRKDGVSKSEDDIQKLLAKLLPVVLKSIKGNVGKSESTPTKKETKPTTIITTATTTPTTSKTPTTKLTRPSRTTGARDANMEDMIKNLLPLLLKKARKAKNNPAKSRKIVPKPKPRPKPRPTEPPKQKSQPKNVLQKANLKSLLASLGIGGLDSNSLTNPISISKLMAVTQKTATKPTEKPTTATVPRTSTVLPVIPFGPELTRPRPTFSVTTNEPRFKVRQPQATVQPPSLSPLLSQVTQPVLPQVTKPVAPPTYSPLPQRTPLPAPLSTFSSAPRPISAVPPFSIQIPNNILSPLPNRVNSDPYSRNILCFGDSLTSGYYNHGRAFHPYSQRLGQLLNSDGRLHYDVKTAGKVREMAHGSMAKRLPEVLGNSSRFDWVIILGGTNDVAHVKNFGDDDSFMNQLINVWKPRIVRDIEVLHEISHKYGARTVLVTIPETAYEAWPQFKMLWIMRSKLNADLRDYARRSQGNVVLCDLAAKLPRHSLPPQAQALLWNDHLHLTPYGYDKMAGIIYQCLKPYLT